MIRIKKAIITWGVVILWAILIFFMSNMDTNESNGKSMKSIDKAIESTLVITNKTGITDKHPSNKKMEKVIKKLNQPLRKVAHASEYLVFTIILIIALSNTRVQGKKIYIIAILICFIYACTDEYHQTFVKGRTGQFTDTLIDTLGGVIGCLLVIIKNKLLKKGNIFNKIKEKHIKKSNVC